MPDTLRMDDHTQFDAELDALMAVEPRVIWGDTPPQARVTARDVWLLRGLIALGVVAMGAFVWWFLAEDRMGAPWLFWPLTAIFGFILTLTLYEWFCYLGIRPRGATPPPGNRTVDVLTTWCPGEPREMVVATLKAVRRMEYPHTAWLCDEGDDPLLRAACARLGVRHVTRVEKVGAKAGNINNALRQATGEIAVILDPDHEPAPFFLHHVLGFFDDPKVGFVQCAQGYYNQSESLIARGAAEQTYHFYGPVMTGMHGHGTTQAIGANCAFRRAALDSIGGHSTGLAEDMATTLNLYAEGWSSVYVPEILTRGLVPNTFPSYTKQQLKWACGVWDILIESFGRAVGRVSWANRIHYLHNGFFYFRGIVVILAALIPVAALTTGHMPWDVTIMEFLRWFGPVLAAMILVRQAAQRGLMEPAERGFHLVGGFLMNATWWVHLTGTICSILRIKIPYIPTGKEDEAADAWRISLPNFAIAGVSLAAAIYGLSWDWSPFSGLMAAFAVINAFVFGFISVAAQQKTGAALRARVGRGVAAAAGAIRRGADRAGAGLFWLLRRQAGALAVLLAGGIVYAEVRESNVNLLDSFWAQLEHRTERDTGGFLLGAYQPAADTAYAPDLPVADAMAEVAALENRVGQALSLVSIYQPWGPESLTQFPSEQLEAIRAKGAIPMITWEPLIHTFPEAASNPDYANDIKVFEKVIAGEFDAYLEAYATRIRDYGGPVFIRFAHEPDNPSFAWSPSRGNTPEAFKAAWQHVFGYFDGMGATNATWVFSPWKAENVDAYHPGDGYVDWVGLTILNYGTLNGEGSWDGFDALYRPFFAELADRPAPIMIAELGSTDLGGDGGAWLRDAMASIAQLPEIGAAVLFESDADRNWPIDWTNAARDEVLDWQSGDAVAAAVETLAAVRGMRPPRVAEIGPPAGAAAERRIAAVEDGWQLRVAGDPFEIKGVAYGVGHGWRSAEEATRRVIEADFADIAAMGANTVRRYATGWEDVNILRAAEANGLRVLMGLWLDPEVDYLNDTEELRKIEERLVDSATAVAGHPSVLAWGIGNETWGLLKHQHAQPRLTEMRHAYLRFVERLARRVKEIDPDAVVFTALEYSSEIPGALHDLGVFAPSVDAVGINAYYDEHLNRLEHVVGAFADKMPWFLSEFGPDGYWDADRTNWSAEGFALEQTDDQKAAAYAGRWQAYVAAKMPGSIGGVAFSFSDRLEGTSTWFGMADFDRRLKPSYYAMAEVWGGSVAAPAPLPSGLSVEVSADVATPGAALTLVVAGTDWPAGCEATVTLRREATFEPIVEMAPACTGGALALAAPETPGRYRITVSAANGRSVTTASAPLVVRAAGN